MLSDTTFAIGYVLFGFSDVLEEEVTDHRDFPGICTIRLAPFARRPLIRVQLLTFFDDRIRVALAVRSGKGHRQKRAESVQSDANIARTPQVGGIGSFVKPRIDRFDQSSRLIKPLLRPP